MSTDDEVISFLLWSPRPSSTFSLLGMEHKQHQCQKQQIKSNWFGSRILYLHGIFGIPRLSSSTHQMKYRCLPNDNDTRQRVVKQSVELVPQEEKFSEKNQRIFEGTV